ncbi:MAG: cobaltochelatase subunit CobN, partial [Gammaproteobacteria bacterium]
RSAATLVSYLTPAVTDAGVYRELADLKDSLERWRGLTDAERVGAGTLVETIEAQAEALDLVAPVTATAAAARCDHYLNAVRELETSLIPCGMHVVGEAMDVAARRDMLAALAQADAATAPPAAVLDALAAGASADAALAAGGLAADAACAVSADRLAGVNAALSEDRELAALVHALDGRYVPPVPGGDLLRNPEVLPTGRNLHGFDPFRLPSAAAVADGEAQAKLLLDSHVAAGNAVPESVALVLWGTDNIKNEGAPLAQALALMGARPRHDSYGRLCGAELIPAAELAHPRIDVVMTVSGIFRDLLPLQMRALAEAALLAAQAEEPAEQNFVRKHALAYQQAHGCDLATAALRVFSNADGAYGSNVNQLVESGNWEDGDELAEAFTNRKSFAYGADGRAEKQSGLFTEVLGGVDLAYQNLESVELGVTSIDHYFDTLGGIGRAVERSRGGEVPIYISDQTHGEGRVRTLAEQVALETHTRMLNPKWYEGMLDHGFEGVRHLEHQVTNTMGWSATTGQVAPWVYQKITETFILDEAMRERLAALNPQASARVANRLLEAQERAYWSPDDATLAALRDAGEEFEDRLEGVIDGVAA